MNIIDIAAITNAYSGIFIRYAKFSSQLLINHHDTGKAMVKEIKINRKKSLVSMVMIFAIEAPRTFLTPISFLLFCAVNAARPNKPRHEITIAKPAKYFDNVDTLASESYCF